MGGAAHDAAQVHRADLLGVGRIGHVVLLELAGAPAGHVEPLVVHGQVDVGDQWRNRLERLERGRQVVLVGRLGGDGDGLLGGPVVAVAVPAPHRGGQVGGGDDHADEAPCGFRVVRRAQLEHHLVLRTEVDLLLVLAGGQVPEVQLVAVLVAQQQLRVDPVLDHRRGAPLAGDQRVALQVPPGVVGQVLRAPVGFPGAQHVEGVVVQQGDAAGAVIPVRPAEAGQEYAVRAAVQGVRAGVAGLAAQLVGGDCPDELGLGRVRLGVVDVDVRAAQPGQQQVAALQAVCAVVVSLVHECAGAGIPTEMVQLVALGGQVGPADDLAVARRARVDIQHGQRIRLLPGPVEGDHVGELLGRGRGCITGAAVERRIGVWGHAGAPRSLLVHGARRAEGSVGPGCSATAAGANPEQIDVYPVHKHRAGTHVVTQAATVPGHYADVTQVTFYSYRGA